MKKYFAFIGIIELIAFFGGYVYFIIYVLSNFNLFNNSIKIISIISLVAMAIIGPALGILFIDYSNNKSSDLKSDDSLLNEEENILSGDCITLKEDFEELKKDTIYKVYCINIIENERYVCIKKDKRNEYIYVPATLVNRVKWYKLNLKCKYFNNSTYYIIIKKINYNNHRYDIAGITI